MFIGHYGPGFAIKAAEPRAPMWALLGAVQVMDVVWASFIETGVERAHIDPAHALAGSPLVLDYMPYTHSLLGAALISLGFALIVRLTVRPTARGAGWRLIGWITLAGLSHWALDLLVHAPDLTIAGAGPKFGFRLWAYKWPEFALEIALVLAGTILYVRATAPGGPVGAAAPWIVAALMTIAGSIDKFAAQPTHPPANAMQVAAATALGAYLVFIACGAWLDRVRAPRIAPYAAARASSAA